MDIRKGIVGIKSHPESKKILGTGFFVEGGFILTCAHVLEDYYQLDKTFYFEIEGQATNYEARVMLSVRKPSTTLPSFLRQRMLNILHFR